MPSLASNSSGELTFTFDSVLDSNVDQENMYRHAAKESITHLMNGFNVTIFAYG
jgi:hypothetical protein